MGHRVLVSVSGAAVLVALVSFTLYGSLGAEPVFAQTAAPKTAWGQPDLQGIWDFRTITPLQRPKDLGDKAFLTAEEAANLQRERVDRNRRLLNRAAERTTVTDQVDTRKDGSPGFYNNFWLDEGTRAVNTRRTSLVVDPPNGRIPDLTPTARQRQAARREYRREHPADSWLDRTSADRCILGFNAGPPITPRGYNQNMQVFQTPDYVVLLTEMVHTARIVPLDGRAALDESIPQWSGDSRGYWEGDTLVVETSNFYTQQGWRGSTVNMKLVERFTRLGADTLGYTFTVTDPEIWTSAWTASIPMQRTDVPMYEYACHEGNYSMPGILGGARAQEAKPQEAKQ